jgi:hypothetical protein
MDTKDRRPKAESQGASVGEKAGTDGVATPRRGRYHGHSDSGAEHRLLEALTARTDLPPISQQVTFDFGGPGSDAPPTMTVDFYLPIVELVVEVDGYTFHYMERVFTLDRRKDRAHALAGRRVIRFTAKDVTADPARCAAIVAAVANTHHGLEVF